MSGEDTAKKKKRKKGWIVFLVITLILVGVIAFQILGGMGGAQVEDPTGSEKKDLYAVSTTFSRLGVIRNVLETNGEVVALVSVDAFPDVAGRISSMRVSLGDTVRKGQILAMIDPSKPGMNYAQSPVLAPVSGTVSMVGFATGRLVGPQVPIVTVGDLSRLQLQIHIPERYIAKISRGAAAVLELEAFPGEVFDARVSEYSPIVDPLSRTMEVKLDILDPDSVIKTGMFAKASLILEEKDRAILVDETSLIQKDGVTQIYLLNPDSTVSLIEVERGITESGVVEITSGLDADREIVLRGMNQLEDGAGVNVVEQLETIQRNDGL